MLLKKELGEILVDMYQCSPGQVKRRGRSLSASFRRSNFRMTCRKSPWTELARLDIDPQKIYLVHLITKNDLAKSNSEARKLIEGGGVSLNNEKIADTEYEFALTEEVILKVGKRRFLRIRP